MSFINGTVSGFRGQRGVGGGAYFAPPPLAQGGTFCCMVLGQGNQLIADGVEADVQWTTAPNLVWNGLVDLTHLPEFWLGATLGGPFFVTTTSKVQLTATGPGTAVVTLYSDYGLGFQPISQQQVMFAAGALTQSAVLPIGGQATPGGKTKIAVLPTGTDVTVNGLADTPQPLATNMLFILGQ